MAFYNELKRYQNQIAAISEDGQSITYGDLHKFCNELEHKVYPDISMGNNPKRDLIFVFCRNTVGALASYLGSLNLNMVPLLLSDKLEPALLKNLLECYTPQYIAIPEEEKDRFEMYECIADFYGYCIMKTGYPNEIQINQELALLLTTSGSTGSPKLVRQSFENIQDNADSIARYLELDSSERPVTALPMNYTFGLSIINSHLLAGATICLTDRSILEKEFWNFIKEKNVTSLSGVPYTFEVLQKLRFTRMDLPSLRMLTQAGGKLSKELHRIFAEYAQETNRKFVVMYGQTEATARMSYLPCERAVEKQGSIGIAIPGGRFELIDAEGKQIKEAEVSGELVYYGKNVTLGYAECALDLEKGDERFGRLETGDIAKRDQDGYYYIVGRKKRFLKLFGNRVNLDETEGLIKSQFQDLECVCTGKDDEMTIHIVGTEVQKEVVDFIASKLGIHPSAFKLNLIDEIPKNDAGKILYEKLKG